MGSGPGPTASLGTARGLCQTTRENTGRGEGRKVLFARPILYTLPISPSWICMAGIVLVMRLKKLRLQEALTHLPK